MSEHIHVQMDYYPAKESKKKILLSEINLLEIKKHISNYKELRIEEFKTKGKISQKMKSIRNDIAQLEKTLPKLKIPKILKREEKTEIIQKIEPQKKINSNDLERQLEDIKASLQKLQIE